MFRRMLFTLLLLFTSGELLSGSEVLVYGKVQTHENRGVPGAIITFVSQAEGKTDSTYSDENGEYSIYLKIGESGTDDDKTIPDNFKLFQNYPNPFNTGTWIPFELPKSAKVKIKIYNILGQKINTITDEYCSEGKSEVYWGGIDEKGKSVSAGIYFYQLETMGVTKTGKMLLLDGGCGKTIGNISGLSQNPLLKTAKALIQKGFIIRVKKAGFFSFVDSDFVVSSENTAIEKNIFLPQYALCYNNIIDWGEPYTLDWEILITDMNGDYIKNISNHPEEDDYISSWSPDGRYIVYRRDRPIGGPEVYLYDVYCDSLINLSVKLGVKGAYVIWTPDSKKIMIGGYIMNLDGSDSKKLTHIPISFYNDSYHFICGKWDGQLYKSDIDGNSNEFLVDLETIGKYKTYMDDFNPNEELILCHEDSADWTFCYSFLLKTYNLKTADIETLAIADSGWIFIKPKYSNDYSKITFREKYIYDDKNIEKLVILEDGIKKELVCLTGDDEWLDYHSMAFSPNDNYLSYSKNVNQVGDLYWWKSYLHIVNINTNEIKFIDGEKAQTPQWNPLLPY